MRSYDFRSPRLFVEAPLMVGAVVTLQSAQAHYLTTVLRLKTGAPVLVFNGRDGEWRATIEAQRRGASLQIGDNVRAQTITADLDYLFAPLKAARLDYMVQKAVEMGVARF
jgi:16S rRNA (uracil1498-N3)-methyltransferase